jgi:hypothetical protein
VTNLQDDSLATAAAPQTWVFDVDGCVIDLLSGASLRPGARELLEYLNGRCSVVVWWSAGGDEYARRRATQLGVAQLIAGFHAKRDRDKQGRYRTEHLPNGPTRVFVDDRPDDLPDSEDIVAVSPYLSHNPHDRGLHAVRRRAGMV